MKLVWTYDPTILSHKPDWRIILVNYYIHSITCAKELGYYTIVYTLEESKKYFEHIADEVILTESENSPLFDWIKIKVLESRADKYCLIDGDLILHERLPEVTTDIIIDCLEEEVWNGYAKAINLLTTLNIKEKLNIWTAEKLDVFNCGILYIGNEEFKQLYIRTWKAYNEFVKENLESFSKSFESDLLQGFSRTEALPNNTATVYHATAVGAQYLLTLLAKTTGISYTVLQPKLNKKGEYYKHYSGAEKYKPLNPIPFKVFKEDKVKSII